MRKIIKFFKILFSEEVKYRKNPNPTQPLSVERQFAISLAAPNTEQTESFIDSLATGKDKRDLQEDLADYWGIEDRPSAIETIREFSENGHRRYFPLVFAIIQQPTQNWPQFLNESVPNLDEETAAFILEYCENLKECADALIKAGDITAEDMHRGISAWDYGRVVNLCRFSFDMGFITEDEAWAEIDNIATKARQEFSNWRDYGWSFFLGRCMWRGMADMGYSGMRDIVKDLSANADSPWVKSAW